MGKYLPIIVTADCGSLTRAGKILGYAQPNMGSIVTRFENELDVKLFHRSQHGVTLTEAGKKLVDIMRQIDDMENYMHEVVSRTRKERFRVGVFQSVATQWLPQVAAAFSKAHPDTVLQIEYLGYNIDNESAIRENCLDCTFFRGTNFPTGMQHVPLITEPFYLLVPADSPLAGASSLSLMEVAGKYPYIHTNEAFDWEEPYKDIRQKLMERDVIKIYSPEDSIAITMVSQGLGICLIPRLNLHSITPAHQVKAIPVEDAPVRTISLLFPKDTEPASLTPFFLQLLQKRVAEWELTQTQRLP